MVKHGDQVIMFDRELEQLITHTVLKTLSQVNSTKVDDPNDPTLDIMGAAAELKVKRAYIDQARKRKNNPLVMVGSPARIKKSKLWDWFEKHSGDYQPQ